MSGRPSPGGGALRRGIVSALLITPSGALSPGPLSAAGVAAGLGLGVLGGVMVALGHLAVELPYFVLLLRVMGRIERALGRARRLLDAFSGGFMLFFAALLVGAALDMLRGGTVLGVSEAITSPLVAFTTGVVLTGTNAYFLAWWLSAGKPIVDGAREAGPAGAAAIYAVHYSYDLVWLALLAGLGGLAARPGVLAVVLLALAGVLVYYGVGMLRSAARSRGP